MLAWLIDRLRGARRLDAVVVATSTRPENDAIAACARTLGVPCVRGSEEDLVSRLVLAAAVSEAAAIVRVTADCPFVDPVVVDGLVATWRARAADVDLVVNNDPPTFPHGLDAEVLPRETLGRLDAEIAEAYYREWCPLWWRARRELYRILNVPFTRDLSHHRWTVDYAEDLAFAERVFGALAPTHGPGFLMHDVLRFVEAHPEVARLNGARAHR